MQRRQTETEVLPVCRRYGLGLTTYSPLAIGLLSGRFRRGEPVPDTAFWTEEQLQARLSERGERVVRTLVELARDGRATPAQLAIAWLLDHPEVTAPIVGADRPEYVDDVFGALSIELTPEERRALDGVSQWDEPGRYL